MRLEVVLFGVSFAMLAGCSLGRFESARTEIQSLAPGNLDVIQVSTFNGDVEVTGHDSAEVEVQIDYTARGDSEEQAAAHCKVLKCDIAETDGRLILTALRPASDFSSSVKVTLKVPRSCRLEIETSNGAIGVSGMNDRVDLTSSNGAILAEEIDGALNVNTSNGRVKIVRCTGAIDVETSNGRVEFDGHLTGTANRIATSNGSVRVELAAETLVDVTAETSNGSVVCKAEHLVSEVEDDYLRAVVGDGAKSEAVPTVALSIESSNGSINISPAIVPTT